MEGTISETTGVYDFSGLIDTFDNGKDFAPNGKYSPSHFFRGGVIGASGCGKTSALMSMIIPVDPEIRIGFDKLYIFAKDIHEPAYEMLRKVLERTEEEIRRIDKKDQTWKLFEMSDSLKDVPSVDKLNKKIRNLMIFDDWATDSPKEQNIICQNFKMGRKHSCSYFYLSQSYFDIPQFIRKQFTHLLIWRLRSRGDIQRVLKEHNPGLDDELFHQMYMQATEKKYSFMIIDKLNPDQPIRQGFKNFPVYG